MMADSGANPGGFTGENGASILVEDVHPWRCGQFIEVNPPDRPCRDEVVRAKVVVSGYPSPLYNEIYSSWRVVTFDIANHAAGGRQKSRETECIWMNYP
jgi:hypothetical protein